MLDEYMLKVCENCENNYIDGDKYCRYCGSPLGSPKFITDNLACIYGPGWEESLECKQCGFTWKSILMRAPERYCPKCGSEAMLRMEEYDTSTSAVDDTMTVDDDTMTVDDDTMTVDELFDFFGGW